MTRAPSLAPEDGGFQDGFLKSAREQLSRCQGELEELDEQLQRLQKRRNIVSRRIGGLETLLSDEAETKLSPSSVPATVMPGDDANTPSAANTNAASNQNPERRGLVLPISPKKGEHFPRRRERNVTEMAEQTLREAVGFLHEPLHYREITRLMLQSGRWQTDGKTPEATVNSAIIVDMQRNGEASLFIRVRRGIYGLREWNDNTA